MKDKIVCLVGPSGSGKTAVSYELEKVGYNVIHSYTTRPPREENEWGHIFVDEMPPGPKIAYTYINGYHYWATPEQYKGKGTSIYVIDPPGVEYLKQHVDDAEIVVIALWASETERRFRIVKDLRSKHPDLEINIITEKAKERVNRDKNMIDELSKSELVPPELIVPNQDEIHSAVNIIDMIIGGEGLEPTQKTKNVE